MNDDIKKMIDYIEKYLNLYPDWFPEYRDLYLDISRKGKFFKLTDKQINVLMIAYNKIFDKVSPLDSCQDLFKDK